MKLGLFFNEFCGGGPDRVEVRQIQLEKENILLLPCAVPKFIDHRMCLLRDPSGDIHSSALL